MTDMIKSGLVALAVIGCDCDAKMCEYIRGTDAQWSSVADCEADAKAGILLQHENYPLVVAVCRDTAEGAGRMAEAGTPAVSAYAGAMPAAPASQPAPDLAAAPSGTPSLASDAPAVAAAPVAATAPPARAPLQASRLPTWRESAVAAAATIVAPLLASAATGSSTTDVDGRVTTLFRTENGLVSVRGKFGGALASASRTALETVSWLRAVVTPQWF
ncbi:MAG: hypothetical protein Q8Q62_17085 [Mesorhizobium sp.]|nr:hypothetical protein [Mesorhizobium sp.]